jgi:2,4-diketo-3-deoxy-L-fuconate hydrolase
MEEFSLASISTGSAADLEPGIGRVSVAAVVFGERVHPLPGDPAMGEVLADWDGWLERIEADLGSGSLGDGKPLDEAALLAPLPVPRNLYMAGANYADHSREMQKLPADAEITPFPDGPFFFLKPSTTVVGPRDAVVKPAPVSKLDWEVELAAVVGRPARNLSEAEALGCLAGYTIVNDVSARDSFKRQPGTEPPMAFDWFGQKGWATSCPMGPWIVPAARCPDPGDLELTLSVNGEERQRSNTGEMIFSLPAQIAYLSRHLPLLPGDVICTGTPAGVGMGSGTFLEVGDEVVATIAGLGELRNQVKEEEGV